MGIMSTNSPGKWQHVILWVAIVSYCVARIFQLYADRLPTLLIVVFHVVPPAVFAIVHGATLYRLKGMLVFVSSCLGVGALFESLSLRTGFPFGHYYFTAVMGPKLFQLPVLLVLAYLGIGYCAWVMSLLVCRYGSSRLTAARLFLVPALASFMMLAWDLSMEADWSTVDRAWVWRDGGAFYGVPLSNFFGWYLTAYVFYVAFALYCRNRPVHWPSSRSYRRAPIFLYGICAVGNLLVLRLPMAPPTVTDASGRQWITMDILTACALISLLVMMPMALIAWHRLKVEENHKMTDNSD